MVQRWETVGLPWFPLPVARRQEATELFRDVGLRGFGLLGSTGVPWIMILQYVVNIYCIVEGSLEVKLPTVWRDEKQSRAEAERRGRLEERRSEEKE